MEKFDLEYQFDFYLEKVKLKKEDMSPVQLSETKQAFAAGISSMLVMNTEIGEMNYTKASVIIAKLFHQCSDFWKSKLPGDAYKKN
jgi:hypothetical protein